MAMRLSGMMSGMDTESIISQLVDARSTKLNKTKKTQISANWKQDAWKDLNKKLKNLQSKYISNMRFVSSYSKKTTKVSNSSAVSVITGGDAVNGVQSLEINQLAKTGYLTGAELKNADGNKADYNALTKLSELGITGDGTFSVKSGKGSVDISINGDTTISDVLTQMKNAGLNASFDAKNQRFFVSAKESGIANDFSITASDANGQSALKALGLQVSLKDDKASLKQYQEYSSYFVEGDKNQTLQNMQKLVDDSVAKRTNSYLESYTSAKNTIKTAEETIQKLNEKYADKTLESSDTYKSQIEDKNKQIEELTKKQKDKTLSKEEQNDIEKQLSSLKDEVKELTEQKADADSLATQQKNLESANEKIADIEKYVDITENEDGTYSAVAKDNLITEEQDKLYNKASYAAQVMAGYDENDTSSTGATKVSAQDAIIKLNGAEFTNNTNVFEINGLTFTALSETKPGETVTVTTENDTDGIYDMVKGFLKEYNSVINEMDKLYNAESSKGYDPLLTDEKEVMSDTEVEEYEKKIKDSILRRDENVSAISSALKSVMSSGVEMNGKKMYLYDFGIDVLGYFNAADNEKNAYHINGDEDDEFTSGNADKLKSMISSDPDTVISFFSKLSQNLYAKMSDMSKSVDGYRSFGNFFDDKKMKSEYDSYASKIKELEEKLNDYEDSWYKKFSKMETAMAKMQSKTTALSGLLGGM